LASFRFRATVLKDESLISFLFHLRDLSTKFLSRYSLSEGWSKLSENVFENCKARIQAYIIWIAIISWHDVNKVLTENTPMAYLTGKAHIAPTN